MAGSVVLLNGPSSSGKSSAIRELQRLLPTPWITLSADLVLGGYPFDHPAADTGTIWRPLGRQFYETIARFASAGFDVIAEQVFQNPLQLTDAAECLASTPVWFVGVHCDLAVAEERERTRRDGRPIGNARHQHGLVHRNAMYDIEVNTSTATPSEVAQIIAQAIETRPASTLRVKKSPT